ncbi:hypothetical protein GCM10027185_45220 [Spirosoma pulveris]
MTTIKNKADKPKIRLILSVIELTDTISNKYSLSLNAYDVTVPSI